MFGVGVGELVVVVVAILVLSLVGQAWRQRWVPVSREWRPALPADEVQRVLSESFAVVPAARLRVQGDGSSVYTVRRCPWWAIVVGAFTLPLGLLLWLLVKESADLHVQVDDGPDGCRVRAFGRTSDGTAKALDSWLSRMARREQV
jgi:hypothetical protein